MELLKFKTQKLVRGLWDHVGVMNSERCSCVHGLEVLEGGGRIVTENISIMEWQEVTEVDTLYQGLKVCGGKVWGKLVRNGKQKTKKQSKGLRKEAKYRNLLSMNIGAIEMLEESIYPKSILVLRRTQYWYLVIMLRARSLTEKREMHKIFAATGR